MVASSDENPSVLKEAITAFAAAIKLNGNEPKYLVSRANALFQAKRYREALADVDRTMLLAPDNPDLMALRAKITLQAGDSQM